MFPEFNICDWDEILKEVNKINIDVKTLEIIKKYLRNLDIIF